MSLQDGKDTIPFIDWQVDQASKGTPLPTPPPEEAPKGFIGFTHIREGTESAGAEVSVVLVRGRLSRLDREAVRIMAGAESGRRIRSVTEYSLHRRSDSHS